MARFPGMSEWARAFDQWRDSSSSHRAESSTTEIFYAGWASAIESNEVKGEFYPCKPDIFAATYEPTPAEGGGAKG